MYFLHNRHLFRLWLKGELEKNVTKIASLGYDGVELAVRDPNLIDTNHVKKIVFEKNLEVPAIGTGQAYGEEGLSFTHPDEKIREQSIKRIKAQIDFACNFNAQVILGLIRGKVSANLSLKQSHNWLLAALKECATYASLKDLKLAMEPLNRYETNLVTTVKEGIELIEEVGADNLGLLLDTFHMNIEEPSIEESIREAKERLFHFHVADSNRWYPSAGHVDFKRVIATLNEIEYDGYLSAEILPLPDPDTCAEKTIKFLRPLLR
ncbi:MAG: 5-keto-L-gluconate epimerase [bacterium]